MADIAEANGDRPTLQRPPLPSIPDFKSDTKNRYAGRHEQPGSVMYPTYNTSDTGIMSMKESTYSTEDINDLIHNLHCQVETLKDKLHPGSTGKTSSVYENIDRSTIRHHGLPCTQRILGAAHQSGFYRLRYLIDPQVGACRRCVWFLVLTAALALLVFQLFDRTYLFLSQPTSITIETKYYDSLAFPAVTVCNRNMFRLTRLDAVGLYKEVYSLYNADTTPDSLRFSTKALDMDSVNLEFLRNISHRKENFIRGCQWRDVPCGPHNFTETLTDYGLCYTFSPHPVHLSVYGSGPGDGLFLELNVEQYEYLLGGRSAVGARIAVHEKHHVPRMSEKGIDVSVGAHTSLEFDRTKNRRLPSKTRQCVPAQQSTVLYDREVCLSECEAQRLVKTCGCRQRYPDYDDENVYCERFQYIRCLLGGKDMTSDRINCSCPVQCLSVDFDATVSHAAMSTYAADSTVRRLFDRRSLGDSLERSRDMYHRIDKAIFGYDVLRLSGTVDALKKVTLGISKYAEKRKNHDSRYEDSMKQLHASLLGLNTTVAKDRLSFAGYSHIAFYPLVQQIKQRLDDILEHQETAVSRSTYQRMLVDSKRIVGELNQRNGGTLLKEVKQGVESFRADMMNKIGKRYKEFSYRRFEYNKTLANVTKSLDVLSLGIRRLDNYILSITTNMQDSSDSDLRQATKNIFKDVKSLTLEHIPKLSKILDNNIIKSYYNGIREILKFSDQLVKITNDFTPLMNTIGENRASLAPTLQTLHENGQSLSRKFDRLATSYGNRKTWKSQLAEVVNGDEIKSVVKKLKAALNDTQAIIWNLLEASNFLFTSFKPISQRLVDFDVMTPSRLTAIVISLQFADLRDDVYALTRLTEKTLNEVNEYQVELRDYLAGNRVNGRFYLQNFLQLEVYFRDLRETVVTQHRAYGLFDFTCDIGGTLALYMGISALTVFEFVDFIFSGLLCGRYQPYQSQL